MDDGVSANMFGSPVATGSWLYAGAIPTGVRILHSRIAYGTADYEDPPEVRNDREGSWFYVEWAAAGGGSGSVSGPYTSIDEAKNHAQQSAGTPIQWETP